MNIHCTTFDLLFSLVCGCGDCCYQNRMLQFKDTKKVNFLIFTVLFVGGSSFAYYYANVFDSTREYYFVPGPAYVLYLGHTLIAFYVPQPSSFLKFGHR